jgi:hypothetical protein
LPVSKTGVVVQSVRSIQSCCGDTDGGRPTTYPSARFLLVYLGLWAAANPATHRHHG